ncbi:sentrin-specific protease 7-like [Cimex lectularius]|uniref:Ubiquitin-like protease family profile domain-containing protein n=1 Tax=Cimex lectularius TaxID=79782 RepID=A0A8I6RC82_CIMLE|nr:sentrin-specific protease 7-like [Cimex lectularius]
METREESSEDEKIRKEETTLISLTTPDGEEINVILKHPKTKICFRELIAKACKNAGLSNIIEDKLEETNIVVGPNDFDGIPEVKSSSIREKSTQKQKNVPQMNNKKKLTSDYDARKSYINFKQTNNVRVVCRSIRFGLYKIFQPLKLTALFSHLGIKFIMREPKVAEITLRSVDIVRILMHFGPTLQAIIIYVQPYTGKSIREVLKITHPPESLTYFDPCSPDAVLQRITLFPASITQSSFKFIKQMFFDKTHGGDLSIQDLNLLLSQDINYLQEKNMDAKVENKDMKVKQPCDNNEKKMPVVTVESTENIDDYPDKDCERVEPILVYKMGKGGITIYPENFACLENSMYIDDIIIDFYLMWFYKNKLGAEDQKRTHVFSSFFYTRLTSDENSTIQDRHNKVARWTKSLDIFSKDFLIVPLNICQHWMVAVICFPYLVTQYFSVKCSETESNLEIAHTSESTIAQEDVLDLSKKVTEIFNEKCCQVSSESPSCNNDHGSVVTVEKNPANPQPCIFLFNSLAGGGNTELDPLREYLTVEYSKKHKGKKCIFTKKNMRHIPTDVPQQTNGSDCGLFVLQYIEEFFQNPIKNFAEPVILPTWFPLCRVEEKRNLIKKLILDLRDQSKCD